MKTQSPRRKAALVVACALFFASAVHAGDVKVMTSGAFTAPYLELGPRFERASKEKVVTLTTTMGVGVDSIPNRIARGEAVDVVIVAAASLDELIRDGRVVAGSKVDLAKSDIGMAVRAGAPKPDISTVDAFKRTLLQAKSIAYSPSVSGVYLVTELLQRLGIADQVLPKSRRIEGERIGAVVARGDAEIGFQQISELLPVPGIDYVGPLPAEIQRTTVFSAGVAAKAENPAAARAFIRFLASSDAADAIRKSGLEPSTVAPAQDASAESQIRAIVAAQVAAWNADDGKAYAKDVSVDVSFTNLFGMVMYGGPAFAERHGQILATFYKGTTKHHEIRRIRFVTPDVAIVDIDNEVRGVKTMPAGIVVPPNGVVKTQLMEVFVRRGGRWWIEAYHNVDTKPAS